MACGSSGITKASLKLTCRHPTTEQGAKSHLRREMRQILAEMSADLAARGSDHVCSSLQAKSAWESASSVMLYVPMKGEVDILPLIQKGVTSGKLVCLPRFDADLYSYSAALVEPSQSELVAGQFGVLEPAPAAKVMPLNQLDLVLVPGLAFDERGYRLGRGRGFYDQMLASVVGIKCGVAFDQQLLSSVPAEPHDVLMSTLLTPTRWLTFGRCAS